MIARPEVDDLCLGEQGAVERVIGMVVAEEDVGHRLRGDAERGQRIEDQRAAGDHPGIDDDGRVAIAHEDDGAADVLAGVAGVDEVDGGHDPMLRRGRWRRGRVAAGEMRTAIGGCAVMLARC